MPRFLEVSNLQTARTAIGVTDTATVKTAESLGIPTDGVTDAAPIINALPAETGVIHFSGTILCKSPISIPHSTTLKGCGRATEVDDASIILFDNTQSWGANPKLLTLGVGSNIAFSTRVVDAVIDAANIPGSIAVYSERINEQSGLYNVLIRRAMSKGIYIDGSIVPTAQNWGIEDIEVIMSENADVGCIGIDVYGGGTPFRGLRGITVTNRGPNYITDMIGIRLNSVNSGAIRDVHVEYLDTGILLGDTHPVSAITVQNVQASDGVVDVVKIESPSVGSGNTKNITLESLSGYSGGVTNLVNDVPRTRVYTMADNANGCGYYRLGNGPDAGLPVETNMYETADKTPNPIIGQINDVSRNEVVKFEPTSSAVNYFTLKNAATGGSPTLRASGDDTNVGFAMVTKGVANILTQDGSGKFIVNFIATSGAVNYLRLVNATTGNPFTINATGSDTDVSLDLTTKGDGIVKINGDTAVRVVSVPASAGASGEPGQIAYDGSYLYVCTAANTWLRTAIATW